jgi:hypothetical protein
MRTRRLLRVKSRGFVAGAIWEGARCVKASRKIWWMVGCHPDCVKVALLRMDAKWEWLPIEGGKVKAV